MCLETTLTMIHSTIHYFSYHYIHAYKLWQSNEPLMKQYGYDWVWQKGKSPWFMGTYIIINRGGVFYHKSEFPRLAL